MALKREIKLANRIKRLVATLKARLNSPAFPGSGTNVPGQYHVVVAAWIVSMLLLGYLMPDRYYELLQEDKVVEWGTVGMFMAAGCVGLFAAVRRRRAFDALVAIFCLFVAGEEFSWGQRLLGFDAPEYFMAHNYQQEVNVHNLPGSFVGPKWILMGALCGYGILLPLLSRSLRGSRLLMRVGATAPPMQLAPWFVFCIVLLVWYPLTLTGEWVELLAGSLFLASAGPALLTFWLTFAMAIVFSVAMTTLTNRVESHRDLSRTKCATEEVQSLLDEITLAGGATNKLLETASVHKRIWTAVTENYLDGEIVLKFRAVKCDGAAEPNALARRKYAIDPWGSPYWLLVEEISGEEQRVTVYSFGPNRRRDSKTEDGFTRDNAGDDIAVTDSLFWPVE